MPIYDHIYLAMIESLHALECGNNRGVGLHFV